MKLLHLFKLDRSMQQRQATIIDVKPHVKPVQPQYSKGLSASAQEFISTSTGVYQHQHLNVSRDAET